MSDPEKPFFVTLSEPELIALVQWHTARARRIPKEMGKKLMELRSKGLFFTSKRTTDALLNEAEVLLKEHTNRAKGLLEYLKNKGKK